MSSAVDGNQVMGDRSSPDVSSDGSDERGFTEDVGEHELRILQALRRIMRAIDLHSRNLLANHRITGPQLITLLAVFERGPLTSAEIARRIHLSPSTMVGILDRLEEKALIRRVRHEEDRRRILIHLTENGRELLKRAPSPLQSRLAQALSSLSSLETSTIARSLERVVELMGASALDAAPMLVSGPIREQNADPQKDLPRSIPEPPETIPSAIPKM